MAVAFHGAADINFKRSVDDNLLESEEYRSAEGKNIIPIGATEDGRIITRDLSTIPHILICGFTGTGKTAFVQTMLSVLLSKQSPDSVKTLIYDSKRIEYGLFANAPHLYLPIIYDRDKAVAALKYLAEEERRRFRLFADTGCKDYKNYNELFYNGTQKLPELFMVLDDFSYLSLNKNEMFEFLNVLKNGRIAGIHIIAISSLTSTKVLQKELISNIPCRICFRLTSKAESRSILERTGAELLFVPGEMIYKFQNDFCKCQSAYATYENIENAMKSVCHTVESVSALGLEASKLFADVPAYTNSYSDYSKGKCDEYLSEPEYQNEEEPAIKLRDFAEFAIDDSKISVHDHMIHFTKPIMTRFGMGTTTPSFSGKNVTGLVYKKPTLFSQGYMTFEFAPKTKINIDNSYLLVTDVDINNISDFIKIEFRSGQDRMIRLFLQQLSEDLGIPIKRL